MEAFGHSRQKDIVLGVDDGSRVTYIWATKDSENADGTVYRYEWAGLKTAVLVPKALPWRLRRVWWLLLLPMDFKWYNVKEGRLQAHSPDGTWGAALMSTAQVSALQFDGAIVKLSKSLTGGGFDWKLILVGLAIIAAGVLGYVYMTQNGGDSAGPGTDNQTSTDNQTHGDDTGYWDDQGVWHDTA